MKDQIDQARWLAMLAATGIALYLCWLMLKAFISVLEWAVVLVIIFYPVHKQLVTRIKRRSLTALLSCLLVITVVALPLTFLSMALADELKNVIPNLQTLLSQSLNTQTPLSGKISRWIHEYLGGSTQGSEEMVIDQIRRTSQLILGLSVGLVRNVFGAVVTSIFVVFTMYYLFRDGDKIVNALPSVLPLSRQQSETILARVQEVVSASVYGVVTIAMLQGALGGLAFWVLGVPSPVLWAVALTFVCMIPVAGSFMVWLPLSFYLMLKGHWTKAILLILWGVLVVSTIDNFVRPKLIRNQTKLHELFVFFSVLGGISLFGLLGIVLGPVVLAITLGLLDAFKRHGQENLNS